MNMVCLMGRLTRDPEVRASQSGLTIASYTLAVDRRFKRDGEPSADFIRCKAFGKTAEFAERHFRKGVKIAVSGRIETGSYEGKNGKVFTTDIIVDSQEFCESKSAITEEQEEQRPSAPDDFMAVPDGIDEELPFA